MKLRSDIGVRRGTATLRSQPECTTQHPLDAEDRMGAIMQSAEDKRLTYRELVI